MGFFLNHFYEIAAMILFGVGFMGRLLHNNLIKKAVGLNIMDTAVYLFLAQRGFITGRVAPIMGSNLEASVEEYIKYPYVPPIFKNNNEFKTTSLE